LRGVKTPLVLLEIYMSQIGTTGKPVRLGHKGTVRINSSVYGGEARKNYNDNYDKIFGGSKNDVRQKENG